MIASGALPADVPPDFGYVTDAAQKRGQEKLAQLVPNAKHITDTNSGHEIHKEQPQLVIESIRQVVDAVRSGNWQPAALKTALAVVDGPAERRTVCRELEISPKSVIRHTTGWTERPYETGYLLLTADARHFAQLYSKRIEGGPGAAASAIFRASAACLSGRF
jgi:hypothetical protein